MNHLAYLIPTLDRIGGAEQQVILLSTRLAERGWKVSVGVLNGSGGDVAQALKSAGIGFHNLEMRKGLADPRGWIRLHRWISQHRPDVLHAHLPHASLLARWSRLAAPLRGLVDTIHSPATGGFARRLGYRLSARLPDVVTAVSHAAAHPWLRSGMANEQNLAIIPNGLDLDRWKYNPLVRDAMRNQLRLTNEFLWLAVGRLDPVKNHDTLLRAFAMLPAEARLVIAGAGPLNDHLQFLSKHLGLEGRASFIGFESNVMPWMCAADGFVLSSLWEGLPMALLEACACALPAVITDIPGAREVSTDLLRGTAVPVGDANALAAAMTSLMRLPADERHQVGLQMRETVFERFNLDAVVSQWERLYCVLLEKNPQPARFKTSSLALGSSFQLQ